MNVVFSKKQEDLRTLHISPCCGVIMVRLFLRIRDLWYRYEFNLFLSDSAKQSGSIEEYLIDSLTEWTWYIIEIC